MIKVSLSTCAMIAIIIMPCSITKRCSNVIPDALQSYVNPLRKPDFFEVRSLVTIKDLFDARVHLGHREDTLEPDMRQYIFGSRLGHLIFDLEKTAEHLRRALNFAAHIAYRDGIILFVSNYHQHCRIVENTALECKEFAHTRFFRRGLYTNSTSMFNGTIRHPDLLIFIGTLNPVLNTHLAVAEAAKLNIPTIGVVDSNSDPKLITYPIPGNDDSPSAVELYCKLFKTVILRGKAQRAKELEMYK